MSDLRRRLMMKEIGGGSVLPSGYQQVEWIYSPYSQTNYPYIDSGLIDNTTSYRIEARFYYEDKQWEYSPFPSITGAGYRSFRLTPSPAYNMLALTQHSHQWLGTTAETGGGPLNTISYDNWYIGIGGCNGRQMYIQVDDREMITITRNPSVSNSRITLLANADSPNDQDGCCVYKVAYIKIEQNDILVREFIPCYRRADNIAGMYDIIGDVFYTNAGSGSFTVGPDVS